MATTWRVKFIMAGYGARTQEIVVSASSSSEARKLVEAQFGRDCQIRQVSVDSY